MAHFVLVKIEPVLILRTVFYKKKGTITTIHVLHDPQFVYKFTATILAIIIIDGVKRP